MAVRVPHRLCRPALLSTVSSSPSLGTPLCCGSGSAVAVDITGIGGGSSGGRIRTGGCGTHARAMSSSTSPAPAPAPFTTLKERVSCAREIKKSKFIAIAAPISDERSAQSFLSEVRDPKATHNCWAYKLGDQYRTNDDGEPSGTAGKPIYSAIVSSGIDMVMVVVIRYFGGIKLGTGGLVRAYGGVASECLKSAETCFLKPKAPVGMEVPYDLLGAVYHQLQHFQVEDIKQDYDTGKDGTTMVTFKVEYDKIESLEEAINSTCSRKITFYKR